MSGSNAWGMSIQDSTNSSNRFGGPAPVVLIRIAIPAGTSDRSATAIQRLPCRCWRNVSQYNAQQAQDVRAGAAQCRAHGRWLRLRRRG